MRPALNFFARVERVIRLRLLLCNMEYEQDGSELPLKRQNNTLPIYGNKETMNLNSMLLTNIRASPYFKTDLFELKTFHEVVDEIYYKVRSVRIGAHSF